MDQYADSRFLVSCSVPDANAIAARTWLANNPVPLTYRSLHALEVSNAFQLAICRGVISPAQAQAALANLQTDLQSGRLVKAQVNWPLVMRLATSYTRKYSASIDCRSLDILHIPSAKSLQANQFVSFDLRQRSLAVQTGLPVGP